MRNKADTVVYGTCNGCGCEVHSLNLGFLSSTITLCAPCEDANVEREVAHQNEAREAGELI